jgi:hypothetical protein
MPFHAAAAKLQRKISMSLQEVKLHAALTPVRQCPSHVRRNRLRYAVGQMPIWRPNAPVAHMPRGASRYLRTLMMKLPNDTPKVWPVPLPVSASEIEPLVTTCALEAASPLPALASAVA